MFKLSFKRDEIREYKDRSTILILYSTGEYILFEPDGYREVGSYRREKGCIILKPEYVDGSKVEDNIEKINLLDSIEFVA